MPPGEGCQLCKSTRAPNLKHAQSHEHLRTIPLLVGDYCFLKSIADDDLRTCLVMKLYPYQITFASGVPRKGSDPLVIQRLARFIKEMGLVHFAYRCDREAALNSMLEDAIARAGRTGKEFSQMISIPTSQTNI